MPSKTTSSVSYDGLFYDSDWNQIRNLPIEVKAHVDAFDIETPGRRKIVLANHCDGCTAGSGSSWQASIEK